MRSAIGNSASDPLYVTQAPAGTTTADGGTIQPQSVSQAPNASAGSAITPVVAQNATQMLVKPAAGNFYSGSLIAGATAGFFIAYNASVIPGASAALAAGQVLAVAPVAANGYAVLGANMLPDRFSQGIVLLFSTTLATYTAPANAAIFLRGLAA